MRYRLQIERKKRGWTQLYVASRVGISCRSYQNYESGRRDPQLTTANRLQDLFRIDQRELLSRDYTPDLVHEGK